MLSMLTASIIIWRRTSLEWLIAGLTWTWIALLGLYFLFAYTEAYLWAVEATSINRLILHFAPGLISGS